MCVAVPAKVIEINGGSATVSVMGNLIKVNAALVDAKVGDYVLVHAGCVLEVLKPAAAEELLAVFSELEEAVNEE